MIIMEYAYGEKGLNRVYENEKWMVGIKNWKPENDISGIDCLERHNETDELFALLAGTCTLVSAEEKDGDLAFAAVVMQPGQVYNIPQGLWHNTITRKDTKMVLIEDVGTSEANSDILNLTPAQIKELQDLAK